MAHSIGELKLKEFFMPDLDKKKLKKSYEGFKQSEFYSKEMENYTDDYFNYVRGLSLSFKDLPYVSVEERVDFSNWVPEGFGTCDCIMILELTCTLLT